MSKPYKRGNKWWISYFRSGQRFREPGGSTFEEADRTLKMKQGDIAKGIPVTISANKIRIEHLFENVLNHYQRNNFRSVEDVERRINKHLIPYFRGYKAIQVSNDIVEHYIKHRLSEGAAAATINRELCILRTGYIMAIKNKLLHSRPYFTSLKESNQTEDFFTREQIMEVIAHLPQEIGAMIRCAFITGWRVRSELQTLQWKNVNFQSREMRLEASLSKNSEGRTFPINSELFQLLADQFELTKQLQTQKGIIIPWVFHRHGKQIKEFRKSWEDALKNTGLVGRRVHCLRGAPYREGLLQGIPERVLMEVVGHRTVASARRYQKFSKQDIRDQVEKLSVTDTPTSQKTGQES